MRNGQPTRARATALTGPSVSRMVSCKTVGTRYRNPWPGVRVRGPFSVLKWGLTRLVTRPPRQPPGSAFPRERHAIAMPRADPQALGVTWVGHSTLLIQIGGCNVLTDPIWSLRASPVQWAGPARIVPPGVRFDELPPIDVVLLSHSHYDHFDASTIERLAAAMPQARWLTPLGLSPMVVGRGASKVSELGWWSETAVGPLRVGCVPAQHFSQRRPGDRNRSWWCGWTLESADRRIYFAGDTGYHPVFKGVAARFGPFDVACLPIGAYEPRWFMQPIHMNPEEALQAFIDLRSAHPAADAAVMMGIHWGTFRLTDEPLDEPPARARLAWRGQGWPEDRLWIPAHGETRYFDRSRGH